MNAVVRGGVEDVRSADGVSGMAVTFRLDGTAYAVPLTAVERVARMVAVRPVPDAPELVLGVVNVGGTIIPVVDLRRRLGHPPKVFELMDRLILLRAGAWRFIVVADEVEGLIALDGAVPPPAPLPEGHPVRSVVRRNEEIVLVLDPGELDVGKWRPLPVSEGGQAVTHSGQASSGQRKRQVGRGRRSKGSSHGE